MIELIIVMSLIAILSVVALPMFNSRTSLSELGVRDQIGALLEYCRKLALVQQRGICVIVTPPAAPTPAMVQAVYAPNNVCAIGSPVMQAANDGAPLVINVPDDVTLAGDALVQFKTDGRIMANAPLNITLGVRSVRISNETSLVTFFP